MLFSVAGHEVKAEVEKKYAFKSKHSENTLEQLKIHFQVYNRTKIPKIIYSIEDGRKWNVMNSSYYYTEGNPVVRYIFEIEEIEELHIKSLLLNNLKIDPYEYLEEIDKSRGDILVIKAQVELDLDQWGKMEELYYKNKYLSVKRHGISPQKKKMRLSKVIWSKYGKDKIKCAISLYEETSPDFKDSAALNPELDNLKKIAAQNSYILNKLMEVLEEKNILDESDIKKISTINLETIKTLKFGQVDDLDEFMKIYEL